MGEIPGVFLRGGAGDDAERHAAAVIKRVIPDLPHIFRDVQPPDQDIVVKTRSPRSFRRSCR